MPAYFSHYLWAFRVELVTHIRRLFLIQSRRYNTLVAESVHAFIICLVTIAYILFSRHWRDTFTKFVSGKDAIVYSEGMYIWYFPYSDETEKEMRKAVKGITHNTDVKINVVGFKSEIHVFYKARKMYERDNSSNVFIVKINKSSHVNFRFRKIQDDKNWREMAFIFLGGAYGLGRVSTNHVTISCSTVAALCTRLVHLIFYSGMVHGFLLAYYVGKERVHDVGKAITLLGGSLSAYILSLYMYSILKCVGLTFIYCLIFNPIAFLLTIEGFYIYYPIIFIMASNLIAATFITACLIFYNTTTAMTAATAFHMVVYLAAFNIKCDHQIGWWTLFIPHHCFTCHCYQSGPGMWSCYCVFMISYITVMICGCLIFTLNPGPHIMNACYLLKKEKSDRDCFQVVEEPLLDNDNDIAIKIECVGKKPSVVPQGFTLKVPKLKTTVILDASGTCQSSLLEAAVGKRSALKSTVCMCPDNDFLWDLLSVKETLDIYCTIVSNTNNGMLYTGKNHIVDELSLNDKLNIQANKLSLLDKKLLNMAVTFLSDAELYILDDPTRILTNTSLNLLISCIKKRKRQVTILMTCSNGEDALRLADRIAFVTNGKIKVYGTVHFVIRCLGIGTHIKIRVCPGTHIKTLFLYIWLFAPNCICLKKLNTEVDNDDDTRGISLNFFISREDRRMVEFVILNIRSKMRKFGIVQLIISDVGVEMVLDRCKNDLLVESLLYFVYFHGMPIREVVEGSELNQIEQWLQKKEGEDVIQYSNIKRSQSFLYSSVSNSVALIMHVKSDMSFRDFMKVITQRYHLKSPTNSKNSNSQMHQESDNEFNNEKGYSFGTLKKDYSNLALNNGGNRSDENVYHCACDADNNNSCHKAVCSNSIDNYYSDFDEETCFLNANNNSKVSGLQSSLGEKQDVIDKDAPDFWKYCDMVIWGLDTRFQTPKQNRSDSSWASTLYDTTMCRVVMMHTSALLRMSFCHQWRCLPLIIFGFVMALIIVHSFIYYASNQVDLIMEKTKIVDFKEYIMRDYAPYDIIYINTWAAHHSAEQCRYRNNFSCDVNSVVTGSLVLNNTQPDVCLFYNEQSQDAKILSIVEAMGKVQQSRQGHGNALFERHSVSVDPLPLVIEESRRQLLGQMQPFSAQVAFGFSLASACIILFMSLAYLFKTVFLFQKSLILSGVSGILVYVTQYLVCFLGYFAIMMLLRLSVVVISVNMDNDWKCLWDLEVGILFTTLQLSYGMSVFGFITLFLQLVQSKILIGLWTLIEAMAFASLLISLPNKWMESQLTLILFIISPTYGYTKSNFLISQRAVWKMMLAEYPNLASPHLPAGQSFKNSLICLDTHKFTSEECQESVFGILFFCVIIHSMHCALCVFVYIITYAISICNPLECLSLYGSEDNSGASSIIQLIIGQDNYCERRVTIGGLYFPQFCLSGSQQRLGIGYCPGSNQLNPVLTGRDVLCLFAAIRKCHNSCREVDRLLSDFSMTDVADDMIYTYSFEEKRKLHIAMALIGEPHILLLDHPTQDVNPLAKVEAWTLIKAHRLCGHIVILASDCAEECCELGTYIFVLRDGGIKLEKDIESINELACGYFSYVWLSQNHNGTTVPVVRVIRGVQRRFNTGMFSFVDNVRDPYLLFSFAYIVPDLDHAKIYDCMEDMKEAGLIRRYTVQQVTPPLILDAFKNAWMPY